MSFFPSFLPSFPPFTLSSAFSPLPSSFSSFPRNSLQSQQIIPGPSLNSPSTGQARVTTEQFFASPPTHTRFAFLLTDIHAIRSQQKKTHMTIREIDPDQESKHRPNAITNSVLPPVKPTAVAPHSDNNTIPQPLRAKRKALSISNQGHSNYGNEGLAPASDRDQEASMQDSTARSWEDRRMTTKQLRLTAVDSGRRRRTSNCTQSLPSDSGSSPSSSPNSKWTTLLLC